MGAINPPPMSLRFLSFSALVAVLALGCTTISDEEEVALYDGEVIELASEEPEFQKVSFTDEGLNYLYSFSYPTGQVTYLGYPLEGMSPNGGAFHLASGAEIVSFTEGAVASGLESQVNGFTVYRSQEQEGECSLDYRVVELETVNLGFRGKSCEGQDAEELARVLDEFLEGLAVDAL